MNFVSLTFIGFFIIFCICYYVVPARYRYVVITAGSIFFYAYGQLPALWVLLLCGLLTYVGGRVLEQHRTRAVYGIFFASNILILGVFKYTGFLFENLNAVLGRISGSSLEIPGLLIPIGLSFYVFQSCTYLSDIYRRGEKAEKNLIRYMAFVTFFPTVLSGPIQRSRKFLPKLYEERPFDPELAISGFYYFIWGMFEKLAVSDRLAIIWSTVYGNLDSYGKAGYLMAACTYSIYIYADFSGYSDMAIGLARILGFRIEKNFNNPFLSVSYGELWNRWHMSLNNWLIENIYIPLGGSRKGKARKYLNVLVVFLLSGLWHGAQWHFVIWGLICGLIVVLGQMVSPFRTALYRRLGADEEASSVIWCRRIIVFFVFTFCFIFFQNGIGESVRMIRTILTGPVTDLFRPELWEIAGTTTQTLLSLAFAGLFLRVQYARADASKLLQRFQRQPALMQYLALGLVICACIFLAAAATSQVNTQFVYFQF